VVCRQVGLLLLLGRQCCVSNYSSVSYFVAIWDRISIASSRCLLLLMVARGEPCLYAPLHPIALGPPPCSYPVAQLHCPVLLLLPALKQSTAAADLISRLLLLLLWHVLFMPHLHGPQHHRLCTAVCTILRPLVLLPVLLLLLLLLLLLGKCCCLLVPTTMCRYHAARLAFGRVVWSHPRAGASVPCEKVQPHCSVLWAQASHVQDCLLPLPATSCNAVPTFLVTTHQDFVLGLRMQHSSRHHQP